MKRAIVILALVPALALAQNAPQVPAFVPQGSTAAKVGSVTTVVDKNGQKTYCSQVGAVMSCQTPTGTVRCTSVNGNISCR